MGNICNTNICCDQEFEEENLYRLGYQNGCFYVVDTNNQILVKDNEQKGQQQEGDSFYGQIKQILTSKRRGEVFKAE